MALWFREPEILDDPVLGRLTRRQNRWIVKGGSDSYSDPQVSLSSAPSIPTGAQRSACQQLTATLAERADDLSRAAYDLYSPYLETKNWEGPRPGSASELKVMLQLDGVHILSDGVIELLYGFVGDLWPDAMLTLKIENGVVRGESLDD
jgi:hypothetical protein